MELLHTVCKQKAVKLYSLLMSGGNDGEVVVYAGSGLLALAAWCTQ